MTLSRMMRRAASGLLVPVDYLAVVDATTPSYFWELQTGLIARHGPYNLANGNVAPVFTVDGPGMQPGDKCADSNGLALENYTPNANLNSTGYTLAGWIRQDTTNTNPIIGNWNGNGVMLRAGTTGLSIFHNGSNWTPALLTPWPVGTWRHFAVTWDGATRRYYEAGVAGATIATTGGLGSSQALGLGTYNKRDNELNGALAYCGWWINKALTAAEIAGLAGV